MFLRITIGAILAFGMEVSEFLVLSKTSSLTLSVTGVLKEICQLVLAVETKGDQLSAVNVFGLVLCLGGIACHVAHKYSVFKNGDSNGRLDEEEQEVDNDEDGLGLESKGGSAFGFRYRNNKSTGSSKLMDHSPLLDTDEDEDVELFQAKGGAGKPLKVDQDNSDDIIFDIIQRRDQRRET